MPKLKAECTPEEWAAIRVRARASDRKHRAKPERQAYMRDYMAQYMRTDAYRAADRARYTDERREQILTNHRRRRYAVTPARVADMRAVQGAACALCLRPFGGDVTACLDHCHATGVVRGLLCIRCNSVEGQVRAIAGTPEAFAARLRSYLDAPPAAVLELV